MAQPHIECETTADIAAVREVVAAAFATEPVVPDLVERIRASDRYRPEFALVARLAHEVVGMVMLSGADVLDVDGTTRPVLTLSPLAVRPERQGRGIGGALVRAVVARADTAGEPLIILEGSPAYYPRFGFEPAAPLGISLHLPNWAPPEAAMVRRLRTYDPTIRGTVRYPPAFDEVTADRSAARPTMAVE